VAEQNSRAGWVFDHREPVLTADLEDAPPFVEHAPLLKEGIRSAVTVPLATKGKILGTLNVGSHTPGRYSEDDASLLVAIGEQVALAIENLLAYEQIAALKARLEEEKIYLQEEVGRRPRSATSWGVPGHPRGPRERAPGGERPIHGAGHRRDGDRKGLIVRAIHGLSLRKDKLLVKVNCAALRPG